MKKWNFCLRQTKKSETKISNFQVHDVVLDAVTKADKKNIEKIWLVGGKFKSRQLR